MEKEPVALIKDFSELDPNFYLKLDIEFGPAFLEKDVSNEKFVDFLKEEKEKHKSGFVGLLLTRILESIEKSADAEVVEIDKQNILERKYSEQIYLCGTCGRNKKIYSYYDPVLGVTFRTCDFC